MSQINQDEKITLRINSSLKEKAVELAKHRGESVSAMLKNFLVLMTNDETKQIVSLVDQYERLDEISDTWMREIDKLKGHLDKQKKLHAEMQQLLVKRQESQMTEINGLNTQIDKAEKVIVQQKRIYAGLKKAFIDKQDAQTRQYTAYQLGVKIG